MTDSLSNHHNPLAGPTPASNLLHEMDTQHDGGPAFPGFQYTNGYGNSRMNEYTGEWEVWGHGMSLRDWFAGQALAMLGDPGCVGSDDEIAKCAYKFADAMIKAREVKP